MHYTSSNDITYNMLHHPTSYASHASHIILWHSWYISYNNNMLHHPTSCASHASYIILRNYLQHATSSYIICICCITHHPMTFLTHYLQHATSSYIMCIPCITHHPMTFLTHYLQHTTSYASHASHIIQSWQFTYNMLNYPTLCASHASQIILWHYLQHATSSYIMCIPCITYHPMTFLTH